MQNNKQKVYIIKMINEYPFGEQKQTLEQKDKIYVAKKLVFLNENEKMMITKMAQLLEQIKHQSLINIINVDISESGCIFYHYQYVPLVLEKWILNLGDDIFERMELDMLTLATHLTQNGIKFIFDHKNIGLSQDMKVKYFLEQFQLEHDNKLKNYKEISNQISNYFKKFKQDSEAQENQKKRHSADSAHPFTKLQVEKLRETWQASTTKNVNFLSKKEMLAQKVASSKMKSLEIIEKFKALKK